MTSSVPSSHDAAPDAEQVRAAMRLRSDRPGWVIVWAAPMRCYTAAPLFRAPRRTHLTAATPGELAALMDQVEQIVRPPRSRSRHLDT